MPTKSSVLAQARKWIGTHESPSGSDRTPIGVRFGWNGVPWCAETMWVVLTDAGFHTAKNASAHGLCEQLISQGWKRVSASSIQSGDIVKFTFSHVGICEARRNSGSIITIEGNHNRACMRVVRGNNSISYGVRPPYTAVSTKAPTVPAKKPAYSRFKVNATKLNLRKNPGTGSTIIATMKTGTLVQQLAPVSNGWMKVKRLTGTQYVGYVSAKYLTKA
jgi:uncharacterized protein YgiM (DUF1202 family)